MKNVLPVIACLSVFSFSASFAQTLTINISGIRSYQGALCIGIYTNSRQFETDQPFRRLVVTKERVKNGKLTVIVKDLPTGKYGIAVLDDENNNGKMDYGLLLPAEGYGFSDYRHTGLRRPKYENFVFETYQVNYEVSIELKYY
jgi:uncharacterized protein (DUF2141 family)